MTVPNSGGSGSKRKNQVLQHRENEGYWFLFYTQLMMLVSLMLIFSPLNFKRFF